MSKYIRDFVSGHGISFEKSKRNVEAFERALLKWKEIGDGLKLDGRSVVMLCGAKNNGKSSLIRYLINSYNHPLGRGADDDDDSIEMMDETDRSTDESNDPRFAYFIDYDPGQPELTTPGVVSASIIRASAQPLQSPTYLNLKQHEQIASSSVGGTNMSVNPRIFIDNCRYVYNQVKEHRESNQSPVRRPIFINTMGFIRNVGLAMLMDLIKICRPTNLIVLNVESDPMRIIYADLTPCGMDNTRASFYYETNQQIQKKLNYKCDIYNLQFSFVDSSSMATKNRTALQMAYMAAIPEALYKPMMQLKAKWISTRRVSIHCVSSYPLKEGIVVELLHHSWIHLVKLRRTSIQMEHQQLEEGQEVFCKLIDDVSENTLYGCGIVAELDLERRRLAVITPVDQKTLDEQIDCIIKPLSIQVPREMLQEGFYD